MLNRWVPILKRCLHKLVSALLELGFCSFSRLEPTKFKHFLSTLAKLNCILGASALWTFCATPQRVTYEKDSASSGHSFFENAEIMEKSRQERPQWVSQPEQKFFAKDRQLFYIDRYEQVSSLTDVIPDQRVQMTSETSTIKTDPKALKKTSGKTLLETLLDSSMNHGSRDLAQILMGHLAKVGANAHELASLDGPLQKVTRDNFVKSSKVSDVYFEKRRLPASNRSESSQELYYVWVLIGGPETLSRQILATLAQQLRLQPTLAALSTKAIQSLDSSALSH